VAGEALDVGGGFSVEGDPVGVVLDPEHASAGRIDERTDVGCQCRHPLEGADEALEVLAIGAPEYEVEVTEDERGAGLVDADASGVNAVSVVGEVREVPKVSIELEDLLAHLYLRALQRLVGRLAHRGEDVGELLRAVELLLPQRDQRVVGAPVDFDRAPESRRQSRLLDSLEEHGVSFDLGWRAHVSEEVVERVDVGGRGGAAPLPVDGVARHCLQTAWAVQVELFVVVYIYCDGLVGDEGGDRLVHSLGAVLAVAWVAPSADVALLDAGGAPVDVRAVLFGAGDFAALVEVKLELDVAAHGA